MGDRTRTEYGAMTQVFHWVTAIVVLAAFIYGPGGPEDRVYSAARDPERQLHETLGLCVLALTVLRLLWKIVDKAPEPVPLTRWMKLSAGIVKGLLYLLLFAVPLTAIAGAWLEGHPLTLLFGIEIRPLLPASHATGKGLAEIHTLLGDAILWLAGLHAVAGLYHHHVLKDRVLGSMVPRWVPIGRRHDP